MASNIYTKYIVSGKSRLISARRPYLGIVNKIKRTCRIVDFAFRMTTEWNWKKAKREISTKTLLENWKTKEHESDSDTNCY